MEVQKEAIALQKEGLALFRKQLADQHAGRMAVGAGPVYEMPTPTTLTLQVRKISNGFIIAQAPDQGPFHDPEGRLSRETYCEMAEGVLGTAAALIRGFCDPVKAPEVPDGT